MGGLYGKGIVYEPDDSKEENMNKNGKYMVYFDNPALGKHEHVVDACDVKRVEPELHFKWQREWHKGTRVKFNRKYKGTKKGDLATVQNRYESKIWFKKFDLKLDNGQELSKVS